MSSADRTNFTGLCQSGKCFAALKALMTIGLCCVGAASALAQFTTIKPPAAVGDASANGTDGINVVGDMRTSTNGFAGWLYNGSTFTTLMDPLALDYTQATCVSGNKIAGQYGDAMHHVHGFVYDGTSYTTVPMASDFLGQAITGMQGNTLVGYASTNSGFVGYIYDGSTYKEIVDPNGTNGTFVSGISGNTLIGRYTDSNNQNHAFEYNITSELFSDFSVPGSTLTALTGIDGTTLAGAYQDATGLNHGFLYDGTQFTIVDDPNIGLHSIGTVLTGVSGGTAVGYYQDSNYSETPFEYSFTPSDTNTSPAATPEPGSCALIVGFALAGAGFLRRRKGA